MSTSHSHSLGRVIHTAWCCCCCCYCSTAPPLQLSSTHFHSTAGTGQLQGQWLILAAAARAASITHSCAVCDTTGRSSTACSPCAPGVIDRVQGASVVWRGVVWRGATWRSMWRGVWCGSGIYWRSFAAWALERVCWCGVDTCSGVGGFHSTQHSSRQHSNTQQAADSTWCVICSHRQL